ncbi:hypothetical protein [Hymenobacter terrestris]|uniref:YtxH domain-containing protein n=1 Tax=Hymenobacter terrestris TaxID=2748310 RepID=A0ABX2Q6J5_9BACT|nr:hypothetical protein [Hymenobacter terrestris]NVO86598.1 hypothetical protein [Hymenobacter terrestris]
MTKLIAKLSTGQKLVGGVALMAAGLTYLATRETEVDEPTANHHRHDRHHHGHLKESATGPNFSTEELVATRHHPTSAATREPRKNLKA